LYAPQYFATLEAYLTRFATRNNYKHHMPRQINKTGTVKKRKNPIAVAFGMLGASKGGEARAAKLSPKRRRDIAKRAVEARWDRYRQANKQKK
jgi:hypothetical protein